MILIPIGTKAQLIKMAPVILALKQYELPFDFVLTGQHQETMSDLINGFGLPEPTYNFAPINEADTSVKLASWALTVLRTNLSKRSQIAKRNYQYCLVHGDTASTLISAIIARWHRIKVVHIEAGLRSHNLLHPFPEEITRLLVSRLSSVFYCSGQTAHNNILKLKKSAEIIDIGQNTLLDSVRFALKDQFKNTKIKTEDRYCVVSIHRFENIANPERLNFIMEIVQSFSKSINVKFVLHSATKNRLRRNGWASKLEANPRIDLLPRMRYFEFINLISRSQFLVSDGGSNQEECSYLKIPCLLMRKHTEREEGLNSNVTLSKYDTDIIKLFFEENKYRQLRNTQIDDSIQDSPSIKLALDLKKRISNQQRKALP